MRNGPFATVYGVQTSEIFSGFVPRNAHFGTRFESSSMAVKRRVDSG